jgi:apolipoprotein N-acyltransferase
MILSLLLCFFSSLLLVLSFPKPDFYIFAFFSFVPLFFALENKTKKQAFGLAYLWGLFFWAGLVFWLINVTFLGYIFLILYLALYFAVFGLFVLAINYKLSTINLFLIPCVWVFLEFLRSHLFTGFGWALLGYSQYKNLALIQISDITGVWGVSFLIVLVNVVIYSVSGYRLAVSGYRLAVSGKIKRCLISALCLIATLSYGYYKLYRKPHTANREPLRVSLIQANIPPTEKWDEHFKDLIVEKYSLLSRLAARDSPDLIIWPETAFPGFWEEEGVLREKVLDLAKELKAYLLIGVPALEGNLSYNASLLISSQGQEIIRYRKVHLVPFGEYIPFAKIFRFLGDRFAIGDYKRGKEFTVFSANRTPLTANRFAVLICFEDIFPNLVRKFVQNGAELLVNITEDGWYGKTGASFQHTQAAVFRAVENRRYLVRVANTGYSCIINSRGKVISEIKDSQGNKLFITGTNTAEVVVPTEKTMYSSWGDWFAWACLAVSLLGIFSKEFSSQ